VGLPLTSEWNLFANFTNFTKESSGNPAPNHDIRRFLQAKIWIFAQSKVMGCGVINATLWIA